ncbi:MAG: glycosyltransferase [Planctomycetes bacterium]|nr:glycosyltransferase [Planctomycetota bacterium]
MRIALLVSSLSVGGTERQALLLAGGLAARGHALRLVTLFPGGALEAEARALERVQRVQLWDHARARRGLRLLAAAGRLARALADEPPQVLYCLDHPSNLVGALAARRLPVPLVWSMRESSARPGWKLSLLRRGCALLRGRAALLIANSQAGLERMRSVGALPRHSLVIGNAVDPLRFRPATSVERGAARAALGWSDTDLVAVLVARLTPDKDHATFLRAAARAAAQEARLRFLCVTPEPARLSPALAALAGAPALAGRLRWHAAGSDVRSALACADLLVSSSLAEGFPNALLEAQACALPIAATDAGASREIVGPAGRIVPPRDPAALAAAVVELARLTPTQRAELGVRARERVLASHCAEHLLAATEAALAQALHSA